MVQKGQLWPIVKHEAGPWPLRSVMEARCLNLLIEMDAHRGPGAPCGPRLGCGLWALDGPRLESFDTGFIAQVRRGEGAFGRVKLWGRVFPYEHGWRAQFARPISLYRLWPESREKELSVVAEGYGIPIEEPPPGVMEGVDFVSLYRLRETKREQLFQQQFRSLQRPQVNPRGAGWSQHQVSQHVAYLPPLPSPFAVAIPPPVRAARFARGFFITSYVLAAGNLLGILMDVLTDDLRWFTGVRATAAVVCGVAARNWWRRWKGKV